MKQTNTQTILRGVDEIADHKNELENIMAKQNPKLALDITPTRKHDPCHDLFRIYTFKLLKELSKKFEILLIYRDIQATLDISADESKKLIEENISLFRSSQVPFKVYYESELLQKHLSHMPEKFFKHLYHNILSKDHNHHDRSMMLSSASLAVLMPLLEIIKIDALLCMEEEKENIEILRKIYKDDSEYFPVIIYRSLMDMQNKKHSPGDKIRTFPRVGWNSKKILENFKKYSTNIKTLEDWYNKLGLENEKVFEIKEKKTSFSEIVAKIKKGEIKESKVLQLVASQLSNYLETEGNFLELASKELKIGLDSEISAKVLSCLNTPSRVNIVKILNKGDLNAYEIAKQINVSLPTTLFHLTKLQEAGIIERNNKFYSLKNNRFILYV